MTAVPYPAPHAPFVGQRPPLEEEAIPDRRPAHPSLMLDPALSILESMGSVFKNREAPLEIDIGCGKGRFLCARASASAGVNFIGIDRLTTRLAKVERKCIRMGLTNVALLHSEISHALRQLIPASSVRTYFVFFPDPWPKRRHHRRRLFSPETLSSFHRTMAPGGAIHVATDDFDYFRCIVGLFGKDPGFIEIESYVTVEAEQTDFERVFLGTGARIHRRSFRRV